MPSGLKKDVYEELRNSVNVIIHNAWKLDFNLSLSSFEPNVQSTRNLIDLARSSEHASSLRFLFTSSISSAFSWDRTLGPYPEAIVTDAKYAVGNGYGESKYVAERDKYVVANPTEPGQSRIGCPSWSNQALNWMLFPPRLGHDAACFLDAMDAVSQSILDVAFSKADEPALNIVHPNPLAWDEIMAPINEAIVREGIVEQKLPIVEFQTWFSALEAKSHDASEEDISAIPAIKLLEFFRTMAQVDVALRQQGNDKVESGGLPTLSTSRVQEISDTMKGLPKLAPSDTALWVQYWKHVGLFRV
ncbi:hypothetical protein NLJ89_g11625 [Agrocybe chaxingu]|uniref:Thioester reductase (TE) domain-containing protein n=1 Tax=Agrocybe chaxingu TaxID=84603 RepID=A0A9W8JVY8_9AGAR|nr:hypothetical protein NLJ89_g11625 [Agrocybe chaxingu]